MNRQQHESTADGDGMSDKSIIQKAREALSTLESEAHSHGVRSDFRHQLAAEIRAGLNEAEQACAQGQGDAEPVAWWDGDFGEPETAFSFEQDEIYTIPVCTKSHSADELRLELERYKAIARDQASTISDLQALVHCQHQAAQPPSAGVPDVGAMADTLGEWIRNTTGSSLTQVTLVDIVRVMLTTAQPQQQESDND